MYYNQIRKSFCYYYACSKPLIRVLWFVIHLIMRRSYQKFISSICLQVFGSIEKRKMKPLSHALAMLMCIFMAFITVSIPSAFLTISWLSPRLRSKFPFWCSWFILFTIVNCHKKEHVTSVFAHVRIMNVCVNYVQYDFYSTFIPNLEFVFVCKVILLKEMM